MGVKTSLWRPSRVSTGEGFNGLVESDCSAEDGCIEALTNEHADLYRFDDKVAAEQFATAAPGALQSDWIIDESLTQQERDGAFELVDATWLARAAGSSAV